MKIIVRNLYGVEIRTIILDFLLVGKGKVIYHYFNSSPLQERDMTKKLQIYLVFPKRQMLWSELFKLLEIYQSHRK